MKKSLWTWAGSTVLALFMMGMLIPALLLLLLTGAKDDLTTGGAAGGGLSSAVPAEYAEWVLKAGQICPEVPPALIAAQIESESNWNPNAKSPVGATGIAQFMPFNFHLIKDENGNGTASALDPADAIMAQGRFMCGFVPMFKDAATGEELMKLLAAAYNAGPGAVLPNGCGKADTGRCKPSIPNNGETPPYVARIMSLMAKYQAAEIPLDGDIATGAWVHPVAQYSVGGTYRQIGIHWRMCGWHTGYDYSAPMGTPIKAAYSGTVVHAAWGSAPGGTGGAYGNQVILEHPGGIRTYYAHLSAYAVSKGDTVTTGQLLGQVGQTGNAFGAHLHFEMTKSSTVSCDTFMDGHAYISNHLTATTPTTSKNSGTVTQVIAAARSQLGVRYSYGGGSLDGPSANMAGVVGFDCSSLVRYAWYQGSGKRITLPRTSQEQAAKLSKINSPEPGDLIVFQLNSNQYDHVGLYLGGGKMIHAPNPRKTIEVVDVTSGYYANHPHSYRRPS